MRGECKRVVGLRAEVWFCVGASGGIRALVSGEGMFGGRV